MYFDAKNNDVSDIRRAIYAMRFGYYKCGKYRSEWTIADNFHLKNMFDGGFDISEIAVIMGRPERGTFIQIESLGLFKTRSNNVIPNVEDIGDTNIRQAIYANRFSAFPCHIFRGHWTKDDDELLRNMFYSAAGISEMAVRLGRTEQAVFGRIGSLALYRKVNKRRNVVR